VESSVIEVIAAHMLLKGLAADAIEAIEEKITPGASDSPGA
jgi:hypothetical protein